MKELRWMLEKRAVKNKMTIVFGDREPEGWTVSGEKENICGK